MSNQQNDHIEETMIDYDDKLVPTLNDSIVQMDLSLDEILTKPLKGISEYLIAHYTTDELHIMQRLVRQRKIEPILRNHYVAIFNLAESIKKVI